MTETLNVDLDRLGAYASRQAARIRAEQAAQAEAERARQIQQAAQDAAIAYTQQFSAIAERPPALAWTGYPRGEETDSFHVAATAHLGRAILLAHAPYNGRRNGRNGAFTLVAADHPDPSVRGETGPAHVHDPISLAEAIARIDHDRRAQAGGRKETETQ